MNILARSTGRKAASAPPIPNWPRPDEPERFVASRDQLLEMYRQMVLIRRFEERAGQLYGMGQIGGFCHLYIGQEACAAGAASADGNWSLVEPAFTFPGHRTINGVR